MRWKEEPTIFCLSVDRGRHGEHLEVKGIHSFSCCDHFKVSKGTSPGSTFSSDGSKHLRKMSIVPKHLTCSSSVCRAGGAEAV